LVVKSLENVLSGIRLLNVRTDAEDNKVKATVYVPEGKESYFINRFEKYLSTSIENEKQRHKDLINSIENMGDKPCNSTSCLDGSSNYG
jgi:hypothetical protein